MNINDLRATYDYDGLARLFGVSASRLKAHLYSSRGYWGFDIPKKSGGVRSISAPVKLREELQRRILPVLNDVYRPGNNVHGFVFDRNVATNAVRHVGKQTLVNADLLDFFPSITFKRVRGIFLAPPFHFNWTVANVLAQICCDQGILPAGGITSPAISNIACASLDKRLSSFVKRLGGVYTRYADDMTMSFDRPLRDISSVIQFDDLGAPAPGKGLMQIVGEEGFSLNLAKLRASTNNQRKIVTGLVVNSRVNVRRTWYLALESLIYAMDKFGVASVALQEFPEEGDSGVAEKKLLRRVHGKISYYRMVRGRGDWLVAGLANRFNRIHDEKYLRVSDVEVVSNASRRGRAALIVAAYDAPMGIWGDTLHQGTGFVSASGLIITASHVINNDDGVLPHVYVMSERKRKLVECDVIACDKILDIALLKPKSDQHELTRVRFSIGNDLRAGDEISAVGFPAYELRDPHVVVPGFVTRVKARIAGLSGKIALVDCPLQGGMSGGPILGRDMSVRAIVHRDDTGAGGIAEAVQISEAIALAVGAGYRL